MPWTTPKTDFANGDVLTATQMNNIGEDLQYLYDVAPDAVITTKGDLIAGNTSGDASRVPVGTNNQRLIADSAQSQGVKWIGDTQNTVIDAEGDLLVGDAADLVQRLAIGTNGQVLTVDTTVDGKLKWAAPTGATFIGCRAVQSTTATSLSQNTWTTIAFNSETFDTDTMHDNVTNNSRITIKTAGKYLIGGINAFSTNATCGARIYLNGTSVLATQMQGNSSGNERAGVSTIYDLAVNDYLQLQGFTSGTGVSTTGNEETQFWAYKIG